MGIVCVKAGNQGGGVLPGHLHNRHMADDLPALLAQWQAAMRRRDTLKEARDRVSALESEADRRALAELDALLAGAEQDVARLQEQVLRR